MSKTRVPAAEGWFTMDEAAPQLLGRTRHESGLVLLADRRSRCRATRARRARNASRSSCRARGTAVVVDDEPLRAARAVRRARPVRAVHGVRGRARAPSRWSCSASSRPAPTPTQLEVGMEMELVLGPLYEDDEHEYVVWQWAPLRQGSAPMSDDRDIAILGAGMHPWGKWGRNFVEYGVVAAQAALADAGVEWRDIQFVSGADTMRNGYPGYVAGATFAQALGWNGAQVASSYAACASGVTALVDRAGADPRRVLRRRARHRRRHHAEGLPRARTRASGATTPTGCASGCSARPTRRTSGCTPRRRMELFGATRDDFARVKVKNARHGLENPNARYRKEVVDRRRARRADRLRPARPARHLRDERRRAPRSSSCSSTTRSAHGVDRSGARRGDLDGDAELPADDDRAARTSRPTARPASARCPSTASRSRSRRARTRRPGSAPTTSTAPRSTTSRPRWSSTGTSRSGCARPARPRSCSATARRRSAAASR